MSNIGYAIFKKTETFVIDTNGIFEQLKFSDTVFVNDTPKLTIGEKRMCFQRIASNRLKSSVKDAILVTSITRIQKNKSEAIIGSAIIFKSFQTNENKIIDGVQYLLNQLKRNFEGEYTLNDNNLGVILPSVNGNFNIFKEDHLQKVTSKQSIKNLDTFSLEKGEAAKTLHSFCTHTSLNRITYLVLASSHTSVSEFAQNGFEKVNIQQLITPQKKQSQKIALTTSNQKEYKELQTKLTTIKGERDDALKAKKTLGLFAIITSIIALVFGVLFFTNTYKNTVSDIASTSRSSLYETNENMYISFSKYNVNVRSSPIYYKDNRNVKATLSDGDEIKVLGFDKQTMWAKISYNENNEVGFVSNKLISKKIDRDRVKKIKRNARIRNLYFNVPIYNAPEEIGENDPYKDKFKYLNEYDKIFVKSEDLRLNSYSIMYKKNGKIHHGYIQRQYFEYQ